MFSKKAVVIVSVIVLVIVNIVILMISSKKYHSSYGPGKIVISLIGPFQDIITRSIEFSQDIWNHYFYLVSASKENVQLKRLLAQSTEKGNRYREIDISNQQLRKLLQFRVSKSSYSMLAAEVIGKDPSPWFKTIIIDKGEDDGVQMGLPIVVPEGIAGQVIDVAKQYAKVLLIIDRNSAVDALVQRTRARGIVKGKSSEECSLEYVLRKHDIQVGDGIVSSGLDGVFPKGFSIGKVSGFVRRSAGIFQDVIVTPHVDFEKLEKVLVVLIPYVSEVKGDQ